MTDEYIPVSEERMTLEKYPCGLESGMIVVPLSDVSPSLKKHDRCRVLTGDREEPSVVWLSICATEEQFTWDDADILDYFKHAPPKDIINPQELQGKKIFAGIRKTGEGKCFFDDFSGTVESAGKDGIAILRDDTGKSNIIPFLPDQLEKARHDMLFTFRQNGETCSGIDISIFLRTGGG